jgi:hypothetical protein
VPRSRVGRREGQARRAGEKGRKGGQGASGLREVLAGILFSQDGCEEKE